MSEVIDNKIVSMEFDNRRFEKNVATSMNTLDKLKQSLKFRGATQGLDEVNSASGSIRSTFEQTEITATRAGFHLKDVWLKVASVFEYQIAGRIISSAKNMVSALTIEPIKTGLSEYETQLNSVQTILANTESKGSTLEDVNAALDELNTYADKTIYNFTEMTRNIGTFTAAGVDLDTSVSAIKGIANLAAVSGSTSQQASTAMYQLSQALSSGTVRLMDWNSVVNAGMGGEVFQNALKATAKVHGVAIDDIIKKNGSFRESLKDEWLTAEILTETLNKFTMAAEEGSTEWGTYMETLKDKGYTEEQAKEILKMANTATDAATKVKTFSQLLDTLKESAQSGWAQTWEIIVGDFEEAKELWTGVSNVIGGVIGDSADARNKLLSNALGSGWEKLMSEGIMDEGSYSEHLKKIAKERHIDIDKMIEEEGSLEKALRKCFQEEKLSANDLSLALGKLSDEYENMSDEELKAKGYSEDQRKALIELNKQVQHGKISMDEYVKAISQLSGREHIIESFKELYRYITEIIKPIKEAWEAIFPSDLDKDAKTLYSLLERFHKFTSELKVSKDTADKLKRTFQGLFAVLDIGLTIAKTVIKIVAGVIGKIFGLGDGVLTVTANIGDALVSFKEFIKSGDSLNKFADNTISVFGSIVEGIKRFFTVLKTKLKFPSLDGFANAVKKVWSVVKNIFSKIGEVISDVWTQIKENFTLENIDKSFDIISTGLLTGLGAKLLIGLINFVKNLKKFKLSDILEPAKDLFEGLSDTLGGFQKKLKADALKQIATAVVMLVGSIIILSFVDHEKVVQSLTAVGILLGLLVGALAAINAMSATVNSTKTVKEVGGAFKKFKSVKESITSVGRDTAQTVKNIGALVGLAAAVALLAIALKSVSKMKWDEIGRGLVGVTGCLVVLLGSLALIKVICKIESNTGGTMWKLIGIVIPLIVLAGVLKQLGNMSWDEIWRGLTAMSISLVTLSGTLTLLYLSAKIADKTGNKSIKGLGKIVAMLATIAIFLQAMAGMTWDEIGRGLTAMGASFAILTGVIALVAVISKIKGSTKKTINTLYALIISLAAIAAVLKVIATMTWDEIGRGLTAMAGSLGILTGVVALLALIGKIKGSKKGAGQVLVLTGALLLISVSLKTISQLSWEEIARGLTGITGTLGVLIGVMAIMSRIKSNRKMATQGPALLIVMASALLLLAIDLKLLASMSWEQIGKSLLSMTVALAAMVGVLAIMSKMGSPTSIATSAASLIIMAVAINLLVPALALLGALPIEVIGKGLLAIAGAMVIFGLAAWGLTAIGATEALLLAAVAIGILGVSCLTVGAGLTALAAGLTALAGMSVAAAHAIVNSMTVLIIGFIALIPAIAVALGEGFIAFCSVIGQGAYAIGEMLVSVLLAALDVLVTVVPELASGLLKIILGILDALSAYTSDIAVKLCDIVFCLILTALDKLIEFVPQLIQKVVDLFMSIFQGVTDSLKSIDTQTLIDGILSIGYLAALMAALSAITALIPGAMLGVLGMGVVIAELALLLAAIGALSKIPGLSDIIADGGNLLKVIGTAIGQFIGGIIGGIAQGVTSSLPAMATDLSNFMTNLTPFLDGIKSLDASVLENGKTLANLLLTITAANILEQLTSWLTGGSSLAQFASEISAFGVGIKNFAKEVSGIDGNSVKVAAEAGKTLGEMAKSIPTSGGLWDLIAGKNDISGFGKQLGSFGQGVKDFASKTAGVNGENVKMAAEAGKTLAQMAKEVPTSGGLWDLIAGKNDLKDFGNQLKYFGEGVKDFATATSGVNGGAVKSAAEAAKSLCNVAKSIDVPVTFKTQIKRLGEGISAFVDEISGMKNVSGSVSQVTQLITSLNALKTNGLDALTTSLNKAKTDIPSAIKKMLDSSISAVEDKTSTLTSAFKSVVTSCIGAIKNEDNYSKFYSSGKYLVQGFAAGISENDYLAAAKAKAMANAAADAARVALDEHSPSKVGYEIGDFFGIAFVNAIDNYAVKAYNAAYDMASEAKTGLGNAISKVSNIIENGIDSQPTIRPVLDLSDINSGVAAMNGMFGLNPSIGVAGSISASMNKNQNGSNDDIISAIKDLSNKFENTASNNTYNINGINTSDTDVQEAIETLVRAVTVGRRM